MNIAEVYVGEFGIVGIDVYRHPKGERVGPPAHSLNVPYGASLTLCAQFFADEQVAWVMCSEVEGLPRHPAAWIAELQSWSSGS